jgi:hypothetical protein
MMKKVLVYLVLAFLSVPLTAPASERAGDVVAVRGDAFVERQNLSIKAEKRFELLVEDIVRTEEQARIKMLFRDDSILTLGPKSRLIIKQYLYSPQEKRAESIYELVDGRLRSVVGNAVYKVTTPTAFSAARGTTYLIWYDVLKEVTGIAVFDGEVEAGNIDPSIKETVVVRKGEVVYIFKNMPPSMPSPIDNKIKDIEVETIVEDMPDLRFPVWRPLIPPHPEWAEAVKPPIEQRPEINTKIYIYLNFP